MCLFFDYEVVFELCRNVPIRLDDATTFFSLLREDLSAWLKGGGSIQGTWGKLIFRDNSIDFNIAEPEPQLDSPWEKPSSFEWKGRKVESRDRQIELRDREENSPSLDA